MDNIQDQLRSLIEADHRHFEAALQFIETREYPASGNSRILWHTINFDGDGNVLVGDLARRLVKQIVSFAIPVGKRADASNPQPEITDWINARSSFNLKDRSGEPGEILLFFLLELVEQAPQLICKMDLKTNASDESKGADGVHVGWCNHRKKLKLYFGEAKLHADFQGAAYDALKSIATYYDSRKKGHDLLLVTRHFKHSSAELKRLVTNAIDPDEGSKDFISQYAALIGYDCDIYRNAKSSTDRKLALKKELSAKMEAQKDYIMGRIEAEELSELELHFFILPFDTVQIFRDKFNEGLVGASK